MKISITIDFFLENNDIGHLNLRPTNEFEIAMDNLLIILFAVGQGFVVQFSSFSR